MVLFARISRYKSPIAAALLAALGFYFLLPLLAGLLLPASWLPG